MLFFIRQENQFEIKNLKDLEELLELIYRGINDLLAKEVRRNI